MGARASANAAIVVQNVAWVWGLSGSSFVVRAVLARNRLNLVSGRHFPNADLRPAWGKHFEVSDQVSILNWRYQIGGTSRRLRFPGAEGVDQGNGTTRLGDQE